MKGSAVAQGWKALASKINNQVPLGPKESNRLLTALTSSFRKHLDEVHPSQVPNDGKRPATNNKHQTIDRHDMHSSAALADKHLASVLTNPLLVKRNSRSDSRPVLDTVTAEAEMDNGSDPLDILESYQKQGHATPAVALACARHLKRSIKDLPHEEQIAQIQATEAGARMLSWLWTGDHMQTRAFVDNHPLQDAIVWFVIMQGHEEFLWQWLHSNIELPRPAHLTGHRRNLKGGVMWKSRILYAMVMTNLGPPHRQAGNADAALEMFFRALKSFHEENADLVDKLILTNAAKIALNRALRSGKYSSTSPFLWDRFAYTYANQDLASGGNLPSKIAWDEWHRAILNMHHPKHPSADLFYKSVMRSSSEGSDTHFILDHYKSFDNSTDVPGIIKCFLRAAELLASKGNSTEPSRLISLTKELFPDSSHDISRRWCRVLKRMNQPDNELEEGQKAQHKPEKKQQQSHEWLSSYFPAPT